MEDALDGRSRQASRSGGSDWLVAYWLSTKSSGGREVARALEGEYPRLDRAWKRRQFCGSHGVRQDAGWTTETATRDVLRRLDEPEHAGA